MSPPSLPLLFSPSVPSTTVLAVDAGDPCLATPGRGQQRMVAPQGQSSHDLIQDLGPPVQRGALLAEARPEVEPVIQAGCKYWGERLT